VTDDQFLDSRLAQLGLEPADIKTVIASHLHLDHAGNLRMLANAGARLLVSRAELEGANSFPGEFFGSYIKSDYAGLPFGRLDSDVEIADGITVLQVPGHTWGTMALRVELANSGTMIFTSDSVLVRDAFGPPAYSSADTWDTRAWAASVEKIRAIAAATNATVVFGHDAEQLRALRLAPGAFYD
jgi:glyoxylase-like metal-dependent hydrolase (beta-lactamase superfamily II)